ncbi:MAG: phosphotransacetylase family protein [Chloroflexi bacterium]|nr:phosphotransacetylase family protein [Chloroflexota bacterium]
MKSLYITSVVTFSGKTALCLGLGLYMQTKGLKVGYMKPISTQGSGLGKQVIDEDADFVNRVLRLNQPKSVMAPVIVNDALLHEQMKGTQKRDLWAEIKQAYETAAQGRDIVLLEGGASMQDGFAVGLNTVAVVRELDTPTLVISRWRESAYILDDIMAAKYRLSDHMLGVVINAVPANFAQDVQENIIPYLEEQNINVYGVLPYQQQLMTISIGELVDLLQGEFLTGAHLRDRLVENLSVGAMTVEAALPRFRRQPNKAVITGGDRADLQAAALETSTLCLVLTGNLKPSATVVKRAEELGVAVVLVKDNTIDTIEKIERTLGKTRLGQAEKLNRFQAMLSQHFNFDRLLSDLDLL